MSTLKTQIMKKINMIFAITVAIGLLFSSCNKHEARIEGKGAIITTTLQVSEFSGISIEGVDNVIIDYGTVQKVSVTGHQNIINRIKTHVSNGTWNMELEDGSYGQYELTYYLTLPTLTNVKIEGTNNVTVNDFIQQDNLSVKIIGTGNFDGLALPLYNCNADIIGSGNCSVSVENSLNVEIDGSGNVYYNGAPSIDANISGSGLVIPL